MCVDCLLASPRIAQVDPSDEPLSEVVLSHVGAEGTTEIGGICSILSSHWNN
jgi:hypothetical protein